MDRHNIGDRVGHSTNGNGSVIATRDEMRTPDPVDRAALTSERLKLQARVEQITRELDTPTAPYVMQVCTVQYDKHAGTKKTYDYDGTTVTRLKGRMQTDAPSVPPADE
jgi:hypothetical protein